MDGLSAVHPDFVDERLEQGLDRGRVTDGQRLCHPVTERRQFLRRWGGQASHPVSSVDDMTSPWWFFETAIEGGFGRRIGRAMAAALAAVLVLGIVWRSPELWLFHSFVKWKTHEIQHQLLMVQHLGHVKPQVSKLSGQ